MKIRSQGPRCNINEIYMVFWLIFSFHVGTNTAWWASTMYAWLPPAALHGLGIAQPLLVPTPFGYWWLGHVNRLDPPPLPTHGSTYYVTAESLDLFPQTDPTLFGGHSLFDQLATTHPPLVCCWGNTIPVPPVTCSIHTLHSLRDPRPHSTLSNFLSLDLGGEWPRS